MAWPYTNHNGGTIVFGPTDGYLYVALGDGGNRDVQGRGHVPDWYDRNGGGNGQDIEQNLLGSILGEAVPAFQGKYLFADWSSDHNQPRGTLFFAEPLPVAGSRRGGVCADLERAGANGLVSGSTQSQGHQH